MNQTCKYCKSPIADSFYFCPNCGKKLKEPPFKFSWSKSISVIILSIIFPPFGIIPGVKYFLKNDIRAQAIGVLIIAVTIISTVILVMLTVNLVNRTIQTYNEVLNLQKSSLPKTNDQTKLLNKIQDLQ